MKLTKKKEKEFSAKIRQIKEYERLKKDAGEKIDELKDEIKAFMEKNKTSELEADIFTVHWSETTSERFDSRAFRKDNEELYAEYLRKTTTKRFLIT